VLCAAWAKAETPFWGQVPDAKPRCWAYPQVGTILQPSFEITVELKKLKKFLAPNIKYTMTPGLVLDPFHFGTQEGLKKWTSPAN
jgi:hypothetical protein